MYAYYFLNLQILQAFSCRDHVNFSWIFYSVELLIIACGAVGKHVKQFPWRCHLSQVEERGCHFGIAGWGNCRECFLTCLLTVGSQSTEFGKLVAVLLSESVLQGLNTLHWDIKNKVSKKNDITSIMLHLLELSFQYSFCKFAFGIYFRDTNTLKTSSGPFGPSPHILFLRFLPSNYYSHERAFF